MAPRPDATCLENTDPALTARQPALAAVTRVAAERIAGRAGLSQSLVRAGQIDRPENGHRVPLLGGTLQMLPGGGSGTADYPEVRGRQIRV